jgi:hypothetical protein
LSPLYIQGQASNRNTPILGDDALAVVAEQSARFDPQQLAYRSGSSGLVPAAAPSGKSARASMAASGSSKLSRNPKKPIQCVATAGRQCCIRILFARGNGFIQQCPDFLASDAARGIALAPGVAHFVRICGEEFSFQGVEQRR